MVGLRDVAAHAGVCVRTVSNVVNDFRYVSPATRARVQASIDTLGYRPNAAARTLRRGRTGLLALVVPEIDSPYFAQLAARTVRIAETLGWTVLIDQTDGDVERERRFLRGERSHLVDGVLFSPWSVTAEELAGRADPTPMVLLGEHAAVLPPSHVRADGADTDRPGEDAAADHAAIDHPAVDHPAVDHPAVDHPAVDHPAVDHPAVDHVLIDNVAAAAEATGHLLAAGRTAVAAVGVRPALASGTAHQRQLGYRRALRHAGVPVRRELEAAVASLHRAEGYRAMTALLQLPGRPDAAFCFSDELALGALRAVADAGLGVPDDVALVGFDDVEDGRYAVPRLTTVAPDTDRIARLALESLSDRLAGDDHPPRVIVAPHRLVVRDSG